MQWIDEMFVNMEKDRAAVSLARKDKMAKAARKEDLKNEVPGAWKAWNALVSTLTNDVNEFNSHRERVGQTPVRISRGHYQCEVHLSGMQGKSLVLTLENNHLHVSVHPEFPKQPLAIAIELDRDSHDTVWLLGESTKENARLSDHQLSEYLLRPVLSSAPLSRVEQPTLAAANTN